MQCTTVFLPPAREQEREDTAHIRSASGPSFSVKTQTDVYIALLNYSSYLLITPCWFSESGLSSGGSGWMMLSLKKLKYLFWRKSCWVLQRWNKELQISKETELITNLNRLIDLLNLCCRIKSSSEYMKEVKWQLNFSSLLLYLLISMLQN